MPDAKIIQFPTGGKVEVTPVSQPLSETVAFDAWCEVNVLALGNETAHLEGYWNEDDKAGFWKQARALRELLNSWPIPD